MKRLVLIRHAAAVHDGYQNDFDRSLRQKGRAQTAEAASFLSVEGLVPGLVLSSPSARTVETVGLLLERCSLTDIPVVLDDSLYLPSVEDLYSAVRAVREEINTVWLCSHNAGISLFAESLTGGSLNMPTCSVLSAEADIAYWREVEPGLFRISAFHF